jgi:hypothetical protein
VVEKKVAEFSEAMRKIIADDMCEKMGQEARKVAESFDIEGVAATFVGYVQNNFT